ncbi:MAG: glutathione synthase [Candidatus Paracaedibacteraceae bacterium]|nr:glutathione synthase [Candidatus Paracaedibacteraceae bacterium]
MITLLPSNRFVAIQADPLELLKPLYDTSLMLAFEAQQRGFSLFAYTPSKLTYDSQGIFAQGRFFDLDSNGIVSNISHIQRFDLSEAEYVLIRQNPPYDMGYLTALDILSNLPSCTRVLNSPVALRLWSEKSIPLQFKEMCPRTCITADSDVIYAFMAEESTIVLKPLYGFGGQDVFILTKEDPNVDAIIEIMCSRYPFGMIAQAFIKEVNADDRRLLMVGGLLKSVFKRTPKTGTIRSNMAVGGEPVPCEITKADYFIAEQLAPFFIENNIMLSGIDVIGDKLIEVNITSPTGLRVAEKLYGHNLAKDFWNAAIDK